MKKDLQHRGLLILKHKGVVYGTSDGYSTDSKKSPEQGVVTIMAAT